MNRSVFTAIAYYATACTIAAQPCYKPADNGTKFGEDSVQCVRDLSLYNEFNNQKNYNDAWPPWKRVLMNCPASSENPYIHGPAILKHFIAAETDKAKKAALIDTLLCVYDYRVRYFGKEGFVLGRKGADIITLTGDAERAWPVLKRSVELQGNNSEATVLVYYFKSACDLLGAGKITKEEALGAFSEVSAVIDHNLAQKPGDTFFQAALENIEKIFVSCHGIADCSSMVPIFEPKFGEHRKDTAWLKKVGGLMDRQKCNEAPFFFKVANELHGLQPSATSARFLAQLSVGKKDCGKAIGYLKQAVEMEEDAAKKAQDLLSIAKCYAVMDQFGQAKAYALRAASTRGGWGEPYVSLAQWCASGATSCGDNDCTKKAAYWVAVDYLNKAVSVDGSSASEANGLIARYKQHFPNHEECFFQGLKEGDEYQVGCWIEETTKVRF